MELEYRGRGGYRPNSFIRPNHARHAQDRVLQEGCEINERLGTRWAESMRTRQAVLDNRAQVALRERRGRSLMILILTR